ncbi:MAG: hypothetical protein Q7R85_03670 [bacterium]|nr:hypothetical protein [bacterium]
MGQKYDWPKEIPDEAIKEAFAGSNLVSFSARPNNCIEYRSIAFGDLGWWLPLMRVLPLIGITPQMLRPVFSPREKRVQCESCGNGYKIVKVELLEIIETYEQLGGFPIADKPFRELARIFGKSVEVLREDGGTGEHYYLFTVHPSGEIVKVAKA